MLWIISSLTEPVAVKYPVPLSNRLVEMVQVPLLQPHPSFAGQE